MAQDAIPISEALMQAGVEDPAAQALARARLDELKLTNPHRDRMSKDKLLRLHAALRESFLLHCPRAACEQAARHSGLPGLLVRPQACTVCGGSTSRRAVHEAIEACHAAGIRRVCLVGGSPGVREDIARLMGEALRLTMVDGTQTPSTGQARAHVKSHDVTLILGASELSHKMSNAYDASRDVGEVIMVGRRGVEAIAEALTFHARQRGRKG